MLTRFAPAPTGWLHLGHVLNAEYVWGSGAKVLLRIEDHDRQRCRPEYEAGILEDLDWLGYRPDIFAGRQSDRDEVYREAIEILRAQRLVYGCDCSRKQVEAPAFARTGLSAGDGAAGREAPDPGVEVRNPTELWYSGRCRDRGLPLIDGYGWRVRMDPGVECFVDGRLGRQEQDPAQQCGDFLLRDRRGNWTYQFAVTVDDWRQQVDLVIRGMDLLSSTGRQIRLARMLGRERPPSFLHHPLIMKSKNQKLSKSDRDTGVRDLRAIGRTPEQIKDAARRGQDTIRSASDGA